MTIRAYTTKFILLIIILIFFLLSLPLEKTGDWIEYVVRHGGARHLRARVFNIPWYQYYLLDVIAFLVAIVTSVVMVIRLTCRCLCRVCCKTGDVKTKTE